MARYYVLSSIPKGKVFDAHDLVFHGMGGKGNGKEGPWGTRLYTSLAEAGARALLSGGRKRPVAVELHEGAEESFIDLSDKNDTRRVHAMALAAPENFSRGFSLMEDGRSWTKTLGQMAYTTSRLYICDLLRTVHIDGLRQGRALHLTNPDLVREVKAQGYAGVLHLPDPRQGRAPFQFPASETELVRDFSTSGKNLAGKGSAYVRKYVKKHKPFFGRAEVLFTKEGYEFGEMGEEGLASVLLQGLGAAVPASQLIFDELSHAPILLKEGVKRQKQRGAFGRFSYQRQLERQVLFARQMMFFDIGDQNYIFDGDQVTWIDLGGCLRRGAK